MYRDRNNLPPGNLWKMFFKREVGYNSREKTILKTLCSYNKEKLLYLSLKLWDRLNVEFKQ